MADPDTTTVEQELAAMRRLARDIDKLDDAARGRVMGWLTKRYPDGVPIGPELMAHLRYADPYPPDTATPR